MMRYISVLNVLILAAAVFSAMCLFPSPGGAYCVYNHTNVDMDVCGESCSRCFRKDIKSGHHACCPGGHKGCGGHTYITFFPEESITVSSYGGYAPVQVTNHGWVSFFGERKGSMYKGRDFNPDYCKDVTVKVHNNDGDVIYHGGVHSISSSFGRKCR